VGLNGNTREEWRMPQITIKNSHKGLRFICEFFHKLFDIAKKIVLK
jgi:hypothetical protein